MPLALAVTLLSAAALAYEVLLLRLFSEIWWHAFAATVISLALLGYGASGTLLTLCRDALVPRCYQVFGACALLFVLAVPGCYVLAQALGFNPLELAWSPFQWVRFAGVYLVLSLPFLLAATAIGLALRSHGRDIPVLYAADLAGAGVGATSVVALLQFVPPERCLLLVAVPAGAAVLCCYGNGRVRPPRLWVMSALAAVVASATLPSGWLAPRHSEYKGLSLRLQVPGAQVIEEHSGPVSRVHVVGAGSAPYRQAAGMSLQCKASVPEQRGVYVDGELAGVVDTGPEPSPSVPGGSYLECLPLAAPYALLERPRVAVLDAGTGVAVRTARHFSAAAVTAIEADPSLARLLRSAGGGTSRPGFLEIVSGSPRAFLAGYRGSFDLIQISTADGSGGGPPGIRSSAVDYLFTVEGFGQLLERLAPGGLLSVTTGLAMPPAAAIKVFGTAVAALEKAGETEPGARLVWFRDWSTATVLMGAERFSDDRLQRLREFCAVRSFDLAHLPNLSPEAANRFHLLRGAPLYTAASQILAGNREEYYRRYPYFVRPASDDQPFFERFFRWRLVGESWAARGRGGEGLLPWGYLLLPISLSLALAIGALLVVAPLAGLRRGRRLSEKRPSDAVSVGTYFFCLGVGFLLIEVAYLYRMSLLIGNPVFCAAVVLTSFLVCAGSGSRVAAVLLGRFSNASLVTCWSVAAVAVLLESAGPFPWQAAQSLPLWRRVAVAVVTIAPLAFLMGVPFPSGLSRVSGLWPDGVAWAWGVNGYASVVSATLGALLAVHFGLSLTVWAGAGLYFFAGWSSRRWAARREP